MIQREGNDNGNVYYTNISVGTRSFRGLKETLDAGRR